MWNLFKPNEAEQQKEAIKEQQDYELAGSLVNNPNAIMDEQNLIERREVLVQLSQWQQDRRPTMKTLFHKLSGYYYNTKERKLMKQKWNEGYCNLVGAAKMVNYIETLDHNVMLANWGQKHLMITLKESIAHPLRRFVYNCHNELGIKLEHAEYVFWLIVNTVEPNYWRGWNDGERRKDREIIKVNELRNINKEKSKGLFGLEG